MVISKCAKPPLANRNPLGLTLADIAKYHKNGGMRDEILSWFL